MEAAPNKRSYMRLAIVRALLLGTPRAAVCKLYCRTDRMVRLWIEMFNRGGLDALLSKPRPDRPRRAAFKAQLETWAADRGVRLWFGDESGFEGDPRPRHRWVQPGSKPTMPYRGKHLRENVIGAVCPADGALFTVVVSGVDADVFQAFLDEMAATHPALPGVRQMLILDNASWHKAKRLCWHHFEPQFLPLYSPDLNPIERLWLRLKCDYFTDFIAKSGEELEDHLCSALCASMDDPVKVSSNTAFRK